MKKSTKPKKPAKPVRKMPFGVWRDHMGKTQEDVAAIIKKTAPNLSRIENGRQQYTQEVLEGYSAAIGIDPALIVMEAEPGQPLAAIWQTLRSMKPDDLAGAAELLKKYAGVGDNRRGGIRALLSTDEYKDEEGGKAEQIAPADRPREPAPPAQPAQGGDPPRRQLGGVALAAKATPR